MKFKTQNKASVIINDKPKLISLIYLMSVENESIDRE